jgi:diadenosine tetraphosphate (Ap4A) HIT family hydrolase
MECLSCRSISGEKRISPGPIIYEGTYWLVDHAYPTSHLGWLVIVLKRHAEALHELSREEFAELAEIQYKLAQVMRQDPHVEKEYLACFAESPGFSHIHIHFVPRPKNLPAELKGPAVFELLRVDEVHAVLPDTLSAFCEDFKEKFVGL